MPPKRAFVLRSRSEGTPGRECPRPVESQTRDPEVWRAALAELTPLADARGIRFRETVWEGLGSAPDAFSGLLSGSNPGKQIAKLA